VASSRRNTYTWQGAAERLRRQADANARADAAWLRALTVEESIRIFEALCRGIPELEVVAREDPPPVVLSRLWKR